MTSPIVTDLAHEDVNIAAGLTPPVHEPPRHGKHRVGSRPGLVPVSAMTGTHSPTRRRTAV